jgi:spermidine synthase
MPESNAADAADGGDDHVKPFVYETLNSKALHFSLSEIQSRMHIDRPFALDLEYTGLMMGFLLFNSAPAELAMIGLGGGSLAKYCHRYLPSSHIQVVEINPHVIALRERFEVPADDARFQVLRDDGAEFVRAPPHLLDVLMVDGFDYSGTPPALCSQAFYDDCLTCLKPNGLLVVNLHRGHRDYDIHVGRLYNTFGEEVLVVGGTDSSNGIVFACRGPLLQQLKMSVLRRPKTFDQAAWDDLKPSLGMVRATLRAQNP